MVCRKTEGQVVLPEGSDDCVEKSVKESESKE